MRNLIVLTSTIALAACGGGMGAQSVGSTSVTGSSTPTPSPTPTNTFVTPVATKTYQSQSGVQAYKYDYTEAYTYKKVPLTKSVVATNPDGTPQLNADGSTKMQTVDVTDANGQKVFVIDPASRTIVGAGQVGQLYTANTSTVRSPGITVTYDPRNAQYTLVINQNGLTDNITFQDPAHRTDFSGASRPQNGVPNLETGDVTNWRLKGVQYLQADTGSEKGKYDVSTFFYDLPNDATHQYVTFGGFVRNHYDGPSEATLTEDDTSRTTVATRKTSYERAAFVWGEQTQNSNVPTSGTATYTGGMIASMVNNPNLDINPNAGTWFQWLQGSASVAMDFGKGTFTTSLTGTTLAPLFDNGTSAYPGNALFSPAINGGVAFPTQAAIPTGAIFSAAGSGTVDLVNKGGFTGTFASAQFTHASFASPVKLDIVGSSIDGAFYGPNANEIGASFRIVGGTPDQRVDIIGAFTGKH